MRLSYESNPQRGLEVELIFTWRRGEIPEPVMSASSGPKDYTRNHIFFIFERFPLVERVLMVRGRYSEIGADRHPSPPFLLVENANGEAFDMAGKPVVVEGER